MYALSIRGLTKTYQNGVQALKGVDLDVERHAPALMPVLRHLNDLPAVVSALQARPDWVISANREHWNDDVAARTGLRIVTPQHFLTRLRPTDSVVHS